MVRQSRKTRIFCRLAISPHGKCKNFIPLWTSPLNLIEALPSAGIAQLVEHVICNLGVAGSNPAAGTTSQKSAVFGEYPGVTSCGPPSPQFAGL